MNGWSWLMLHNFLNLLKQATASLSELPALYLLLSGPRPGTSCSQTNFTAWLHLGISKPSTNSSHLRLLYSSGRMPQAKHKWGLTLSCTTWGNPRTNKPSAQLQIKSEHCHPAPAQRILHRGWRLVVSGHSQYLQLTGLGKSLPSICQQQSRLNHKRRVYSAHMKGAS